MLMCKPLPWPQSTFERYRGEQAGGRPGYNPHTDYEVPTPDGVDYAEASSSTFQPSGRGIGRRGSAYNGFEAAADSEA